jgi:hypothetical protein
MNKIKIAIAIIVPLLFLLLVSWVFAPRRVIEMTREHEFIIDKPLKEVRRAVVAEDIAREIIAAHGGEIVDKKLIGGQLNLQRPILRNWQATGDLQIVAKIKESKEPILLYEKFNATPEQILAVTTLDQPLSNGVTKFQQDVRFLSFNNKTLVHVNIYLRLERKIPSFFYQYTTNKMSTSLNERINTFEILITRCVEHNSGFKVLLGEK